MRSMRWVLLLAGLSFAVCGSAQTIEEARLTNAGAVLQAFASDPQTAIPPALLQQAQGIAVIPGVLRMGLIFGGRRGRGVVTVRGEDGRWTNPSFITVIDLVLVFGSARSVQNIGRGKFTLGGDAAVTAGPVDRATQATTDLTFTSEVYAYTDSRGLFAGATLEGTRLAIDVESNSRFYVPGSSAQPLQPRTSGTAPATAPAREEAIIYPLGGASPN
jgi:lipid-binding SYLF domain-containing protein